MNLPLIFIKIIVPIIATIVTWSIAAPMLSAADTFLNLTAVGILLGYVLLMLTIFNSKINKLLGLNKKENKDEEKK